MAGVWAEALGERVAAALYFGAGRGRGRGGGGGGGSSQKRDYNDKSDCPKNSKGVPVNPSYRGDPENFDPDFGKRGGLHKKSKSQPHSKRGE